MPALRWCVWRLFAGMYVKPGAVVALSLQSGEGVAVTLGEGEAPVFAGSVRFSPPMFGCTHVWVSGSGKFLGKSAVLIAFAMPVPSQSAGTPLEAPSVNSTMIRSPDWL